jgi:MoxR-like ATPase
MHMEPNLERDKTAAFQPTADDQARAALLVSAYKKITEEVAKVIVGQDTVIEELMIAILSGGHCLLEGVPGLAKTLMVRCLSEAMDLSFRRIQFTPDLMPADITGTDIIQEDPTTGHRQLVFERGPIFTQMLLADEINRTPPKTQAALLEAMQEHSVTVGGKTYKLQEPFFVLATQNPIEQEGTYPLPEAQRDRFLFMVVVDYPDRGQEREIVQRTTSAVRGALKPVITGPEILACQETVLKVPVPDHVLDFVIDLVRSARPGAKDAPAFIKELVEWGPGPRGGQHLIFTCKARALLRGRYHVTMDDVEALALPVLRHRIVPTFQAEAQGVSTDDIVRRLLAARPRDTAAKVL